jgi:hypothetical protein
MIDFKAYHCPAALDNGKNRFSLFRLNTEKPYDINEYIGGVTMPLITNSIFTDIEKTHLEFVLSHYFLEKSNVVEQLNNIKENEITREVTPYYRIMEFRPNGVNPGQGPMNYYISFEVLHENGTGPTEFTLYQRNGFVFELEICNADNSVVDLDSIMLGEIGDICVNPLF